MPARPRDQASGNWGKSSDQRSDVPFQITEMSSSSGGASVGGNAAGDRVKRGSGLRQDRSDGEGDDPRNVSGGVGSGAGRECVWCSGVEAEARVGRDISEVIVVGVAMVGSYKWDCCCTRESGGVGSRPRRALPCSMMFSSAGGEGGTEVAAATTKAAAATATATATAAVALVDNVQVAMFWEQKTWARVSMGARIVASRREG